MENVDLVSSDSSHSVGVSSHPEQSLNWFLLHVEYFRFNKYIFFPYLLTSGAREAGAGEKPSGAAEEDM